jgi:transposase
MTSSTKYIGMDVHKESISIAVRNAAAKVVMERVIETKASMILQFFDGLRGDLHVTFEEGTWAAWLYDLLKPHVTKVVVCDPRRNALLQDGNQNDRVDARKLSDLLYMNKYYQQLNALRVLRQEVRRDLLVESKKHKIWKRLCEIPSIGPIRAAELLSILQTPHRFRTKRQLWTYCVLGVVTTSSADHELEARHSDSHPARVSTPKSSCGARARQSELDSRNLVAVS